MNLGPTVVPRESHWVPQSITQLNHHLRRSLPRPPSATSHSPIGEPGDEIPAGVTSHEPLAPSARIDAVRRERAAAAERTAAAAAQPPALVLRPATPHRTDLRLGARIHRRRNSGAQRKGATELPAPRGKCRHGM